MVRVVPQHHRQRRRRSPTPRETSGTFTVNADNCRLRTAIRVGLHNLTTYLRDLRGEAVVCLLVEHDHVGELLPDLALGPFLLLALATG